MSHYRNFRLATYFVAHGAAHAERQQLQKDIDFFQHYLHLDNVYLEPFRDGTFASEEQVRMCKEVFEQNGIHVSGGITTAMANPVDYDTRDALHPREKSGCILRPYSCVSQSASALSWIPIALFRTRLNSVSERIAGVSKAALRMYRTHTQYRSCL